MNSIFNQLLNVKGMVVEDARIADSPLRPEPVLEVRVRPRRGMLFVVRYRWSLSSLVLDGCGVHCGR